MSPVISITGRDSLRAFLICKLQITSLLELTLPLHLLFLNSMYVFEKLISSNTKIFGSLCLAYIKDGVFVCEDNYISVIDTGLTVTISGSTPHFTDFGMLVSPQAEGSNLYSSFESTDQTIIYIAVGSALGVIAIGTTIVCILVTVRRRSELKAMTTTQNKHESKE